MENIKTILSISFEEGKSEPLVDFNEDNFKNFIFENGGSHKNLTHLMAHFHRFMWESLSKVSEKNKL